MATEVNVGRVQGAGFFSCSETLVEEGEAIEKGDIRTCYADKLLPKPFSELFDDSDTGYSLAVFINDSVVDDGGHVFTVTAISGEYEDNELVNYLLTLVYRDRFKGEKGETGERGPSGYGIFDLNGKEVEDPSIYAPTTAGSSGSSLYGQGENVAPIWASPIITSLNGTKYDATNVSNTGNKGIYAATSAGSSGQYLQSTSSGSPSWNDVKVSDCTVICHDSSYVYIFSFPISSTLTYRDLNSVFTDMCTVGNAQFNYSSSISFPFSSMWRSTSYDWTCSFSWAAVFRTSNGYNGILAVVCRAETINEDTTNYYYKSAILRIEPNPASSGINVTLISSSNGDTMDGSNYMGYTSVDTCFNNMVADLGLTFDASIDTKGISL